MTIESLSDYGHDLDPETLSMLDELSSLMHANSAYGFAGVEVPDVHHFAVINNHEHLDRGALRQSRCGHSPTELRARTWIIQRYCEQIANTPPGQPVDRIVKELVAEHYSETPEDISISALRVLADSPHTSEYIKLLEFACPPRETLSNNPDDPFYFDGDKKLRTLAVLARQDPVLAINYLSSRQELTHLGVDTEVLISALCASKEQQPIIQKYLEGKLDFIEAQETLSEVEREQLRYRIINIADAALTALGIDSARILEVKPDLQGIYKKYKKLDIPLAFRKLPGSKPMRRIHMLQPWVTAIKLTSIVDENLFKLQDQLLGMIDRVGNQIRNYVNPAEDDYWYSPQEIIYLANTIKYIHPKFAVEMELAFYSQGDRVIEELDKQDGLVKHSIIVDLLRRLEHVYTEDGLSEFIFDRLGRYKKFDYFVLTPEIETAIKIATAAREQISNNCAGTLLEHCLDGESNLDSHKIEGRLFALVSLIQKAENEIDIQNYFTQFNSIIGFLYLMSQNDSNLGDELVYEGDDDVIVKNVEMLNNARSSAAKAYETAQERGISITKGNSPPLSDSADDLMQIFKMVMGAASNDSVYDADHSADARDRLLNFTVDYLSRLPQRKIFDLISQFPIASILVPNSSLGGKKRYCVDLYNQIMNAAQDRDPDAILDFVEYSLSSFPGDYGIGSNMRYWSVKNQRTGPRSNTDHIVLATTTNPDRALTLRGLDSDPTSLKNLIYKFAFLNKSPDSKFTGLHEDARNFCNGLGIAYDNSLVDWVAMQKLLDPNKDIQLPWQAFEGLVVLPSQEGPGTDDHETQVARDDSIFYRYDLLAKLQLVFKNSEITKILSSLHGIKDLGERAEIEKSIISVAASSPKLLVLYRKYLQKKLSNSQTVDDISGLVQFSEVIRQCFSIDGLFETLEEQFTYYINLPVDGSEKTQDPIEAMLDIAERRTSTLRRDDNEYLIDYDWNNYDTYYRDII